MFRGEFFERGQCFSSGSWSHSFLDVVKIILEPGIEKQAPLVVENFQVSAHVAHSDSALAREMRRNNAARDPGPARKSVLGPSFLFEDCVEPARSAPIVNNSRFAKFVHGLAIFVCRATSYVQEIAAAILDFGLMRFLTSEDW